MSRPGGEKGRACPICGRPRDAKFRPFCSKRCADIDLARWLDGRYVVPGQEKDGSKSGNGHAEDGGDDEGSEGGEGGA